MTAHGSPLDENDPARSDEQGIDPIGPVELPKRSWIGARALVLVGAASVLSAAIIDLGDTCQTTTVSRQ